MLMPKPCSGEFKAMSSISLQQQLYGVFPDYNLLMLQYACKLQVKYKKQSGPDLGLNSDDTNTHPLHHAMTRLDKTHTEP